MRSMPVAGERHVDPAPVLGHAVALDETLLLQCGEHAGEGPLGEVALGGESGGLHLAPHPQDPEDREAAPREVGVGEQVALGPAAHCGGGSIDVGDGLERNEVELVIVEAVADVLLGTEQVGRIGAPGRPHGERG